MTRRITAVALLAVGVAAAALLLARSRLADDPADGLPPPGTQLIDANAEVVEVVDGDTLVVDLSGRGADRESLRLIGIDTPESVATDRPNECFGKEATAQLAALVPAGTPIHVQRDVEPRDRYDRLLGYVFRSSDGVFVNHDLVANGFAIAKSYPPNITLQFQFQRAEANARSQKLGLWLACGSADVPLALAGAR